MGLLKLLEKHNLKFEELTPAERETFYSWQEAQEKAVITVDKIVTYIRNMRDGVDSELAKSDLNQNQDIFLKARLRNYMLMEAMLTSAEKAEMLMEQAIMNIARKK